MKLAKYAEGEIAAIVVFGDGPRDQRVLAAASEKHNHRKLLLHLELPPRYSARKGLTPALETAYYLASKYGANTLLIVIDREHLPGTSRLKEELKDKLRRLGFHVYEGRLHEEKETLDAVIKRRVNSAVEKVKPYYQSLLSTGHPRESPNATRNYALGLYFKVKKHLNIAILSLTKVRAL